MKKLELLEIEKRIVKMLRENYLDDDAEIKPDTWWMKELGMDGVQVDDMISDVEYEFGVVMDGSEKNDDVTMAMVTQRILENQK